MNESKLVFLYIGKFCIFLFDIVLRLLAICFVVVMVIVHVLKLWLNLIICCIAAYIQPLTMACYNLKAHLHMYRNTTAQKDLYSNAVKNC